MGRQQKGKGVTHQYRRTGSHDKAAGAGFKGKLNRTFQGEQVCTPHALARPEADRPSAKACKCTVAARTLPHSARSTTPVLRSSI